MFKKILLGTIFASQLFTAQTKNNQESPEFIALFENIPWTVSREPSEIDNNSFNVSVISYAESSEKELLSETNTQGK